MVPDDRYRIRAEVSRWIADPAVQVMISSGGTGLTGRDGTPEAVAPLLDKTMDGFGELLGMPGSLDAVLTAWDRLIGAQLDAETLPCNLVQLLPRLREDPDQLA
jgi:molybdenum cofactor biosynthesis protein B